LKQLQLIDEKMLEMDPKSERFKALKAIRQFRSNWIEIGRTLTEIAYSGEYKEWGYDTFEEYFRFELGLKKTTTKKMMVSYTYMQRNEPARLEEVEAYEADDDKNAKPCPAIPDYTTVELLQKARENEYLKEDKKKELHTLAFDVGAPEKFLRKEIKHAIEEANPQTSLTPDYKEIQEIQKAAKLLERKMRDSRTVPQGLKERYQMLCEELKALDV